MAEQSFPFENIDTTESQFSQWASNFQDTGVQGSPTGTELKVTAEGSTLTVDVALGQSFVRGHYYINTESLPLTVTSAGLNTRIDYVVVELDPEANTIVAKILEGTAVESDPVAPTLTQSATGVYQLPIAKITIPNSTLAVTNEMIADVRTFMSNRVGIWTTATRPANPIENQTLGFNTTIGRHEVWNGTAWVTFADPISTEGDLIVGGASGAPERLPVGTDDQILTVVAGVPEWADGGGGGSETYYELLPLTGVTINVTIAAGTRFQLRASDNGMTFRAVDSSEDVVISDSVTTLYKTFQSATGVSTIQVFNYSSSTVRFVQLTLPEFTAPTGDQKFKIITSTQSVTLDTSYTAYLLGGGGAGGGIPVTGLQGGGGGGGSGYYATGTISAGTYTATVGAGGLGVSGGSGQAGGTTSIGALSAAGGSGGILATAYTGGNGGAGGSGGQGGAGSDINTENIANPAGVQGGDGGDGVEYSATAGTGGAGSGVAISLAATDLISAILVPSTVGAVGPYYSPGNGGGVYGGGGGGSVSNQTSNGSTSSYYGGGGGGAEGDTFEPAFRSGGNGCNGVIMLVEVI